MSKLIDVLKQATKEETRPMGFGRSATEATIHPFIIVKAGSADVSKDVLGLGDAVIPFKENNEDAKGFGAAEKSFDKKPVGCFADKLDGEYVETLEEQGCDFAVFSSDSVSAEVSKTESLGKILIVEADIDNGLLRVISQLPHDAMLLQGHIEEGSTFTWRDLLNIKRIVSSTAKPALIEVPLDITLGGVKALWDSGVDGIMVTINAAKDEAKLKTLVKKIGEESWSRKSNVLGDGVILPKTPSKISEETEVEEE